MTCLDRPCQQWVMTMYTGAMCVIYCFSPNTPRYSLACAVFANVYHRRSTASETPTVVTPALVPIRIYTSDSRTVTGPELSLEPLLVEYPTTIHGAIRTTLCQCVTNCPCVVSVPPIAVRTAATTIIGTLPDDDCRYPISAPW